MIKLVFKYKFAIVALVALFVGIGVSQSTKNDNKSMNCGKCDYWQARVDPSIKLPKNANETDKENSTVELSFDFDISEEDAAKLLEATECLLKLKGKTSSSNLSSLFGLGHSSRIPSPTVEVAALYYISALYHKKWRHANGIILVDKDEERNNKESVETAFKSYEAWFEKVKKIGLEEARKQKLDPLADSGVSWY